MKLGNLNFNNARVLQVGFIVLICFQSYLWLNFSSSKRIKIVSQPYDSNTSQLIHIHNAAQTVMNIYDETTNLKCLVVYGTRPELIKLMPVIKALKQKPDVCKTAVISTGQHRELLLPLEIYFDLVPDGNMHLMLSGQSLASLYNRAEMSMAYFFEHVKPTLVIVQGDTTTAMAAGVAAFHAGIHVVHVEAGLRTGDLSAPFPEEFNRKALGIICSLCFAPTEVARKALLKEGVFQDRVFNVGNTVVDELMDASTKPPQEVTEAGGVSLKSIVERQDGESILKLTTKTSELLLNGKSIVLITAHRRENAASGAFSRFGEAVAILAKKYPSTQFVVPLHYNPSVREILIPFWKSFSNIWLVEPPAYPVFVQLLLRVTILLTDSGGLQEEGISLHLPVLIMRTKTERMEGVLSGGAKLVGDVVDDIVSSTSLLIDNKKSYEDMTKAINPYGDGSASKQIVQTLFKNGPKLLSSSPQSLLSFKTEYGTRKTNIRKYVKGKHQFHIRPHTITVILTGYKRDPSLLETQILALKHSTFKPDRIIFYQNENHKDFTKVLEKYPDVKHVFNRNYNTRFHGRFTMALLADTEYMAVADDEIIPGEKWLEYAVGFVDRENALVGNSGRRIRKEVENIGRGIHKYQSYHDSKKGEGFNEVDFVGHWWIWRTEWSYAMWSQPSYSLWTAEDIEFSAKLQLELGVRSITPNFPNDSCNPENISISRFQQMRNVSSWAQGGTTQERVVAVQYWMNKGWKPTGGTNKWKYWYEWISLR